MPIGAQLSPQEYLRTSFLDRDQEYVRGFLVERAMPTWTHASLQRWILFVFYRAYQEGRLWPLAELRLRLAPDLFRIPDISVFDHDPRQEVPATPPLAVIEILSTDDRLADLQAKLIEYQSFGVRHIWVVDPRQPDLLVFSDGALVPVEKLSIPAYDISIGRAGLGAELRR